MLATLAAESGQGWHHLARRGHGRGDRHRHRGARLAGDPVTEQKMRKLIAAIPGDNGWWHTSGEERYQELASTLREHGVPAEQVVDILSDAYSAVAEEFGA